MGLYLTLRDAAGEHLGVVEILNMDGGIKTANYKATLYRELESGDEERRTGPIWFVHDFPRDEGAWMLVQAVIDRMPQQLDVEPVGPSPQVG